MTRKLFAFLTEDLLKDTETKDGVMVAIEGTFEGDTVHVTKIAEVKVATE